MADDNRLTGSTMIVIDKENDPDGMYDYYSDKILSSGFTICMKKISKGFIEESLEMCDYLIVHTYGYDEDKEKGIRGFACVQEVTEPSHYLYIDLICNYPFHRMKLRTSDTTIKFGGKHILETVKDLAEKIGGVTQIKLSALDDVITYYSKFGYKFDDDNIREEKGLKLIQDLRDAQRLKDKEATTKILNKIVTYYTKFYKETSQKELASVPLEYRKEEHRINGIPMVLDLNKPLSGGKRKKKHHSRRKSIGSRKNKKHIKKSHRRKTKRRCVKVNIRRKTSRKTHKKK